MVQRAASGAAQSIEFHEGHDQPFSALIEAFLQAKAFKPKTERSYRKAFERLIPIHSTLIQMGFPAGAAERRAASEDG